MKLPTNKKFGYFFCSTFFILGGYFFYNNYLNTAYIFLFLTLSFFLITFLKADLLLPLNKIWMKFGYFIGGIVSPIILGIIPFVSSIYSACVVVSILKIPNFITKMKYMVNITLCGFLIIITTMAIVTIILFTLRGVWTPAAAAAAAAAAGSSGGEITGRCECLTSEAAWADLQVTPDARPSARACLQPPL